MMRAAVLILALALAGQASAQVTRCGPELGKWVCRTEQPRNGGVDSNAFNRGYEDSQRIFDDMAAARARADQARAIQAEQSRQQEADRSALIAQQVEAQRVDERRAVASRVASAVANGKCAEAKRIALVELSDIELADAAMRVCTPAP